MGLYAVDTGKLLHRFTAAYMVEYECLIQSLVDGSDKMYFMVLAVDDTEFNVIHCYFYDEMPPTDSIHRDARLVSYHSRKLHSDAVSEPVFVTGPRNTVIISSFCAESGYALNIRALKIDHTDIPSTKLFTRLTIDSVDIAETMVADSMIISFR